MATHSELCSCCERSVCILSSIFYYLSWEKKHNQCSYNIHATELFLLLDKN